MTFAPDSRSSEFSAFLPDGPVEHRALVHKIMHNARNYRRDRPTE